MADLDVLEKLLEQTEKPREQLPASNENSNNHLDDRKSDHENGNDERGDKTYDKYGRDDRYRSSKRSRSRSRTRSRSRDRRRRKYGRSRSRSRERRYHRYSSRDYDRRSSRNRSRSRDRYYRRRSRSRDRIEERRERDANDKKYNVDEHDRDLRTVFIRSLPTKADIRDIKRWFEKASAHVREVRLITDKYTKKSKGFGYVEFYQKESVEKALSLSGSQLLGKTVHVELSEAEKNIEASSDLRASTRIYISNLYYAVNEEMLRAVFEKFGDIEYLNLHFNAGTDTTRGFAFVQYKKREAALKAISMNGAEIMNKAMKVGFVNSKKDMEMGNLSANMDSNADLEDVDYITNHQKFELMHSLNSRDIDSYGSGNEQVKLTPKEEILSKCIVVENMFDPDNEEDPNFDIELAKDVKMECTNKYGEIEDLYVDKKSKGNVYIRFKTVDFAKNAYLGLNGRWFDNKPLSVRPFYY